MKVLAYFILGLYSVSGAPENKPSSGEIKDDAVKEHDLKLGVSELPKVPIDNNKASTAHGMNLDKNKLQNLHLESAGQNITSAASDKNKKGRNNRTLIPIIGVGAVGAGALGVGAVGVGAAGVAAGAAAVGGAALAAGTAAAAVAAAHHIGRHEIERQKAAGTWKEPKAFVNRYANKGKTESVQPSTTAHNPQTSVITGTCTTDLPKPTYPAAPEPNPDNAYPKNPDNIVVPKPFELNKQGLKIEDPNNQAPGAQEKPVQPQNDGYNEKPVEPQNDGYNEKPAY
ncbi:hypothetical protein BB561_006613 [Smittium simulii]|uniref:Uncharacterized protein n=1 Tax=Smittium simulii TaxID=133385 RepID=A0A2T9Y2T2_9FUNG|nr:hypothetical protein BB561_006614 [Smittium simulii]PVU86652.1 hypothetical protein BB561_006613 [Smittium simulii]